MFDYFGYLFYLIYLIPLFIIGFIAYFIIRAIRGRSKRGVKEKDWYLQLFLSKEDTVSQFFFLFSVFFLGITLLAFNKELNEPLSWRTILFFASVFGLGIAYYFKVIYTLAVSLIGIACWWGIQAAEWGQGKNIKSIVLFVGLLLVAILFYLIGRLYEKEIKFKRVSIIYSILGLISVTGALFFFSTREGLGILEEITKGASLFASWEITASLLLFSISILGILVYGLGKKVIFAPEALVIVILLALFLLLALLPGQIMFAQERDYYGTYRGAELSGTGILWAAIFNILVFLELVGIIFLGYGKRENWLINLGAFFIFLLIFVKYFDWFFTFLNKSLFFIGAGILLFVVGWLMGKGRRYMLSAVKKEQVQ